MWDEYVIVITGENSRRNFYMGVELESFSNKDDMIKSGANVLNNNVELHKNKTQNISITNKPTQQTHTI